MTGLDQWFPKCGPWTISITSKLVRNAPPQTRWIIYSGNRSQGCLTSFPPQGESDACSRVRTLRLWPVLIRPPKREHDHIPKQMWGSDSKKGVWHRVSKSNVPGDQRKVRGLTGSDMWLSQQDGENFTGPKRALQKVETKWEKEVTLVPLAQSYFTD